MDHAAIAQRGTPRELYEAPASLFVADFVGDSNLVEGELTSRKGVTGSVRVDGLELLLPHRGAMPGLGKWRCGRSRSASPPRRRPGRRSRAASPRPTSGRTWSTLSAHRSG